MATGYRASLFFLYHTTHSYKWNWKQYIKNTKKKSKIKRAQDLAKELNVRAVHFIVFLLFKNNNNTRLPPAYQWTKQKLYIYARMYTPCEKISEQDLDLLVPYFPI